MVFSSLVFLCGFLPLVLIIYCLCPGRFRNFFLFVASLFFYAWGEPKYILIMLFSTFFDFGNGMVMNWMDKHDRQAWRKWILVLSVVVNIGILCFFKYTGFVLDNIQQMTGVSIPFTAPALPIGISFYTFQTLSYTIDVYRRRVPVQSNLINFGMYVCLFPQLIAGPIVRYSEIEKEIVHRNVEWGEAAAGMYRFILGLAKKVLLANQIGSLWTYISGVRQGDMSFSLAWLGALAYTFQIYFDFSGYSDMAIGLGKLLGFHFPENFRHPYMSQSITEFWRRWHITLGSWFREYVYIPLGGNRKGLIRQIFNLLVVWFLTGLWHGAGWNFILWGLYFFVLLLIEKLFLLEEMKRWHGMLRHGYALFFIVLGWGIFACDDMAKLMRYLGAMFGQGVVFSNDIAVYEWTSYGRFLILLFVGSLELPGILGSKITKIVSVLTRRLWKMSLHTTEFILKLFFGVLLLGMCLAFLISGSYNPFLYFRF
jgi:alginate O-acetyltransferase complex protein AlgI